MFRSVPGSPFSQAATLDKPTRAGIRDSLTSFPTVVVATERNSMMMGQREMKAAKRGRHETQAEAPPSIPDPPLHPEIPTPPWRDSFLSPSRRRIDQAQLFSSHSPEFIAFFGPPLFPLPSLPGRSVVLSGVKQRGLNLVCLQQQGVGPHAGRSLHCTGQPSRLSTLSDCFPDGNIDDRGPVPSQVLQLEDKDKGHIDFLIKKPPNTFKGGINIRAQFQKVMRD